MPKLIVDYPPSLNSLYRASGKHVVLSENARRYKETAGWQARSQWRSDLLTGLLVVHMRFVRSIRPIDVDNGAKCLLDALEGICYLNDRQIMELHLYKWEVPGTPRVEIDIEEVGTNNEPQQQLELTPR